MGGRFWRGCASCLLLLPLLCIGGGPAAGYLAAGDGLAARGQYAQALDAYERGTTAEPWRLTPALRAAALRLWLDDAPAAATAYDRILAEHPASPSAWYGRARAAALVGDAAAAAGAYARAAELGFGPRAALAAGEQYLDAGDLAAAWAQLSLAADRAALRGNAYVEVEARLRLAILGALGDSAAEEAGLVVLAGRPAAAARVQGVRAACREAAQTTGPHRYTVLGRGALAQGMPELAEMLLRRAASMEPDYVDAHAYLALALLVRGHPQESLAAADRALALDPSYALARYARGASLRTLGQSEAALAALKALAASGPAEPSYLLELAATYADLGDYEDAGLRAAEAVAVAGSDPTVPLAAARLYLDRAFQPARALAWAEQAVAALAEDASAWEAYGWALHLVGRDAEAVTALTRAAALDPLALAPHYYLAVTYETMGRGEQARQEYTRAVDLNPADPLAGKARQVLSLGR